MHLRRAAYWQNKKLLRTYVCTVHKFEFVVQIKHE